MEKILKNLGAKCNFANNWVFRPGEFDAGKLSFNFSSALNFFILLRKTQIANFDGSEYLFSIFCRSKIIFSPWHDPQIQHCYSRK
jgi:hypothetical protein